MRPLNYEFGELSDLSTFALRDRSGFLWIGTDNGLKRYDGYKLRSYTHIADDPKSLGSSFIATIAQLSSGQIWAAGRTLNEFHPETESFTQYDISDNKTIKALYEDKQGILWLAGEGFGLRGFDLKTKKIAHQYFSEPFKSHIQQITPNKEHSNIHGKNPTLNVQPTTSIWVLASTQLILFNTKTHQSKTFPIPKKYGLDQKSASDMVQDKNGKIWVATQRGLITFDPKSELFKHYTTAPNTPGALPTNALWSIFEDSKGTIWIGTDKSGVLTYQEQTDNFYHHPPSLADPNSFPLSGIGKISEDTEGNIWVVASISGVKRLSPHLEKFQPFKLKNNQQELIEQGYISDILEDKENQIWTAIDGIGLSRYTPQTDTFTLFQHSPQDTNSISNNSTLSLAEDESGVIWIGTWAGGLNRLNPETGIIQRIQHQPSSPTTQTLMGNNIFRIEPTYQGQLLLSVWEYGLQLYDIKHQTFKSYIDPSYGAKNLSILDILKRSDGKYWIAGYQGLEVFDPISETFESINIPNTQVITNLFQFEDGVLWIASNAGLISYNPSTHAVKRYGTHEGLSNSFVVSIEGDQNGNLWVGTRDGLNRFNPNTHTFEGYSVLDGLSGQKFNRFSHLNSKNNLMYFGGSEGLSVFDPLNIPINPYPPKVHFTGFKVFQTPIGVGDKEWMKQSINTTKTLVLPSSQNDFSIEFSALSLISPTKNQYKYTLEGLNKQWFSTDSYNRQAHYTNLSPGQYTFKVIASNRDDIWSQTAKQLEIIILPPWWLTWWAKIGYLLLTISLLYTFTRLLLLLAKKRQKELEYKINHDPLTGLKNRAWLTQHLAKLIENSDTRKTPFALLYLDGNGFKRINEKYGHSFGDTLIQKTPDRIKKLLPSDSHLSRLESDQFVVVINTLKSQQQPENLAQNIIDELDKPFDIKHFSIKFSFNIGVVIGDIQYKEVNTILRDANTALQTAKKVSSGCWKRFDENMLKDKEEDTELEIDLRSALTDNQFSVVYQPIISLSSMHLTGFELLLRWSHPKKGMIPPDKFIPIAEKSGLIFEIGLWVLKQACLQQQQWKQTYPLKPTPSIAVNLSPLQLLHSNLLPEMDNILHQTGADNRFIKIEITESALVENIESVNNTLLELRSRGLDLAIDDFGTGYSSLSYLSKLPAQFLKIDRAFINDLTSSNTTNQAKAIIKATISLAHNLKMDVVAEGIENQEQMDILQSYHCDYGQGYFIDRPLSVEDATLLLANK